MLPCEGKQKSHGNIFYCGERGQMKPDPKLAQEKERESPAEDPSLSVLNNAGVSITKEILQEQLQSIKSGEISKTEREKVKIEKGALMDLSTVRW